jgi:hypothetical protein
LAHAWLVSGQPLAALDRTRWLLTAFDQERSWVGYGRAAGAVFSFGMKMSGLPAAGQCLRVIRHEHVASLIVSMAGTVTLWLLTTTSSITPARSTPKETLSRASGSYEE